MSSADGYTDDTGIDLHYYENLAALFYATTVLSLVTNLIVCLFHGGLAFYRVIELNRISLRLIVLSACFEVVRAIFRMAMITPADTTTCAADAFFVSWSNIASSLCLALVVVHTVCVLVLNVNQPRHLEKYYYATILVYSTVVCGISARHTPSGYLHQFQCWVRFYFGKKTINEFEWTWYYTALMIPIAVAVICSLILLIRYKMERYNFVETSVRYARNNTNSVLPVLSNRFRHIDPIKIFRNVIIRSFFYALIPLISKLSLIISGFNSLLSLPVSYKSLIASVVLTNAQGVLISILYFSDPAVVYTVKRFGHFLRKVYVDDYCLASDKSSDLSPSPPDSFDDRMRQRYGPDFGEIEHGDWGPAIQLTPIHHDMIAEDNMEDQSFYSNGNNNNMNGSSNDQRRRRRRSSAHQWGKSYTKPPWDPYYNRCLAKTMHWVLTKVCRLKPLPFAESTSTLSYQSYALASHNSLPISTNDSYAEQQQQQDLQLQIPDDGDGAQMVINATSETSIKKNSDKFGIDNNKDTGDADATSSENDDQDAHMDHHSSKNSKNGKRDSDSKDKSDQQGKDGMTDSPSSSMHASSDDNQQYLMLPNTTARRTATKSTRLSPSPLSSSSETSERIPTNSIRSSDEEKSSGSNKGTLSSGSPLSSLRFARQSKKLGLSILNPHHHSSSTSESQQQHHHQQQLQSTPTASPSPASSAAAAAVPSGSPSPVAYDSSPSSKSSSLHLSQTSSLHLPRTSSSSDIDRLSLLSSVESGTNSSKGYEPLTAPPHHYHLHLHHHRRRQRRSRKRASKDTTLPSLSITLAGENEHHQDSNQVVPLTEETPPSSSSASSASSSASVSSSDESSTSSGMGTIASRYHSPAKHGVRLQPPVLKALLLDWEPPPQHHHQHQHTRVEQPILKPDGLEDGWTTIIHIGQAWDTNVDSSSSSSNDPGGGHSSDSCSDRIVSFVEHWFRDYLGSRWFVVE